MPIQPAKLHHVSRQTKNLDVTQKFYEDVLGFRAISRPPFNFRGAWLYGFGMQLHLIEEPFDEPPVAINTRENHIAFAIDSLDDAEAVVKEHGLAYRRQEVPERGTGQIFFRDPDGWLIEVGVYAAVMDQ